MPLPRDEMSKILENLREQKEHMERYQQHLAELSVTVTSTDNVLKVTVTPTEGVTDISFLSLTYRAMPPERFAELLVETIREADRAVKAAMLQGLPPFPIEGVSSEQVLSGAVSFADVLPVEEILTDVAAELFYNGNMDRR